MSRTVTVTNRLATATILPVDGVRTPITGSGTIQVDEGAMGRLLLDPISGWRFKPTGDLSYSTLSSAETNVEPPKFSSGALDLTTLHTVELVPAQAGRSWFMTKLRITLLTAGGGVTAAVLNVLANSVLIEGWNVDGSLSSPAFTLASWAAPVNTPVVLTVATAATGGALTVVVDAWGSYT